MIDLSIAGLLLYLPLIFHQIDFEFLYKYISYLRKRQLFYKIFFNKTSYWYNFAYSIYNISRILLLLHRVLLVVNVRFNVNNVRRPVIMFTCSCVLVTSLNTVASVTKCALLRAAGKHLNPLIVICRVCIGGRAFRKTCLNCAILFDTCCWECTLRVFNNVRLMYQFDSGETVKVISFVRYQ